MSMMMRRSMMVPAVVPGGLPAEYLAVQYLTAPDGQYFDLPSVSFAVGDSIRTQIKFQYNGTLTNNIWVAGDGNTRGGFQYEYGYFGSWWWRGRDARDANDVYTDNSPANINSVVEVDWKHTYTSAANDYIFRMFQRKGFSVQTDLRSMYYLKLYKNETLLYDLIPCIRIADSKPGMYDLVGRQFYTNSGTGEFIAGWTLLPEQDGRVEKAKIPLLNGQHVKMTWDTSQLSTAIPGANESVLSFYNQTGMVWNAMNPVPTCSSHVIVSRNMIDNNVFFGGTIEFDMPADANLFVGYWQDSDTTDRRIKGDYINIQIS